VFEVAEEIIDDAKDFVIKIMEEVEQKFLGEIPAVVEVKINKYWTK
jgi:DNA polymerase I-like protein with 3'-5' exonuclease and polymerase domains